jgi:hypothetical protein
VQYAADAVNLDGRREPPRAKLSQFTSIEAHRSDARRWMWRFFRSADDKLVHTRRGKIARHLIADC